MLIKVFGDFAKAITPTPYNLMGRAIIHFTPSDELFSMVQSVFEIGIQNFSVSLSYKIS